MSPRQSAAKSQTSKKSGSTRSEQRAGKNKGGRVKGTRAGDEETPVTMTGGSIIVEFDPEFNNESPTVGKKVKKAEHLGLRITRVVIRKGKGGPILNEFPPLGVELSKGCFIEIKGMKTT
jgi:hypothetical protein